MADDDRLRSVDEHLQNVLDGIAQRAAAVQVDLACIP